MSNYKESVANLDAVRVFAPTQQVGEFPSHQSVYLSFLYKSMIWKITGNQLDLSEWPIID